MTSRERWTVYPLLFLTLGITLKDKVTKEVTTERVNCRSMYVTDREGKPQIMLGSTSAGGLMRVQSDSGPLWMLGNTSSLSGLMVVDGRGKIIPIAVRSQAPRANASRSAQPPAEPADDHPENPPVEPDPQSPPATPDSEPSQP
jgi:hypothetical protein